MQQGSRRSFVALASVAGGAALFGTEAQAASRPGKGAPASARERKNKEIVRRAFERQNNGGSFFDILDDDVVWTLVGGTVWRGKQQFVEEGSAPVVSRLAGPIRMTPLNIWADGDTVITQFEGDAPAVDGIPYHNEYCWILTFRGDAVVRAFAFLDMVAYNDLLDRVEVPES